MKAIDIEKQGGSHKSSLHGVKAKKEENKVHSARFANGGMPPTPQLPRFPSSAESAATDTTKGRSHTSPLQGAKKRRKQNGESLKQRLKFQKTIETSFPTDKKDKAPRLRLIEGKSEENSFGKLCKCGGVLFSLHGLREERASKVHSARLANWGRLHHRPPKPLRFLSTAESAATDTPKGRSHTAALQRGRTHGRADKP